MVLPMYTDCLIGMGLLISVCASILTDIGDVTSFSKLGDLLADKLPSQSAFWMGYVLSAAFFGLAFELSGIVSLVMQRIGMYEQPEMV